MTDNPYKVYFELMPAYMTILDRDLRIVDANSRFREDFGDFEGRYCFQINQHRSERCEHCPAERTFRDGLHHEMEEKFTNNMGHEIFLLINTTPITNKSGEITHVMKMATDISELKLLQGQLRNSRERYRKLFEEVPCYISIQDSDLRIVDANRRLREDFGASPGDKCHQIYMHRTEACIPCIVKQTFDDGQVHQTEEVMTSPKGEQVNVLVYTAPVRNAEGQIKNVIEMSTNITQIRQLQSQLTSLGLIIGSISHGIKGLLTSLDGGVYLVNTGLAKNDRARFEQGWKMVERNITRIRRMVLDLLYYAKDRAPELEKTSAPALAEEVREVMREKATELGIDFKCEFDSNAGEFDADPKAIRTLLINLVENAIDACRVDKKKTTHEVHFGLQGCPEYIEFDVTDNGIGMDQEIRERAFSLFFSSKRGSGTGLGLFISNKIAQTHGGEIKIVSEMNKGTRMIVKLPRKVPVSGTAAPKA
ncbi:PAS domain-containing sensor histidine kinase [Candidatus Dependentiae bacterium]|nr:PAS domain-containing sensor histidine kinase [Candidatus Dependentiae bacterium]